MFLIFTEIPVFSLGSFPFPEIESEADHYHRVIDSVVFPGSESEVCYVDVSICMFRYQAGRYDKVDGQAQSAFAQLAHCSDRQHLFLSIFLSLQ